MLTFLKNDLLRAPMLNRKAMTRARKFSAIFTLVVTGVIVLANSPLHARHRSASTAQVWVATWGASQQIPEPQNALPSDDLRDATVRQIFHLSVGGTALRVHISNAFGTDALHITSAHIARPLSPSSPAIDPATDHPLTFAGNADVTIPPGAEFISDPLDFPVAPLSDMAVTFHLDSPPDRETGHPGSRATSYYVHGDSVTAANLPDAKHVDHWYQISEIDVVLTQRPKPRPPPSSPSATPSPTATAPPPTATTAGPTSSPNACKPRPPPATSASPTRASAAIICSPTASAPTPSPASIATCSHPPPCNGSSSSKASTISADWPALAEVPPADHAAEVQRVLAAYQQIIARAHAHGLRVYGATITPYVGSDYYHPGPLSEADRQAVNDWIRAPGHFDAVIDFDAVVRDPQHPDQLTPRLRLRRPPAPLARRLQSHGRSDTAQALRPLKTIMIDDQRPPAIDQQMLDECNRLLTTLGLTLPVLPPLLTCRATSSTCLPRQTRKSVFPNAIFDI